MFSQGTQNKVATSDQDINKWSVVGVDKDVVVVLNALNQTKRLIGRYAPGHLGQLTAENGVSPEEHQILEKLSHLPQKDLVNLAFIVCNDQKRSLPSPSDLRIAARNTDLVVHLGDLVYDVEHVDLEAVPSLYKTVWSIPAMQEWAHLAPWIVLPDDHEFIDDYHMGMWNEQVEERIRAWERYTPVAPGSAANLAPGRGGRNFAIDLPGVNWLLVLIDTRSQRSTQIGRGGFPYEWFHRDELFGAQKIMTKQQRWWLEKQMRYARQHNRCLLLVQQGVVGPLVYDTGHNGEHVAVFPGCWDGYASERERLLAMLRRYSQNPSQEAHAFRRGRNATDLLPPFRIECFVLYLKHEPDTDGQTHANN